MRRWMLVVVMVLTACGGAEPTVVPSTEPTPAPTPMPLSMIVESIPLPGVATIKTKMTGKEVQFVTDNPSIIDSYGFDWNGIVGSTGVIVFSSEAAAEEEYKLFSIALDGSEELVGLGNQALAGIMGPAITTAWQRCNVMATVIAVDLPPEKAINYTNALDAVIQANYCK